MLWNYDAHVAQKEREIAKSMKDKGLKIAMIAERTGLTPEEKMCIRDSPYSGRRQKGSAARKRKQK